MLWLAVPAVLALLSGSGAVVDRAGAASTSSSFAAVADSYVFQQKGATNYGTSNQLKIQGSPLERAYIRFNVTGLSGTILKGTLQLNTQTASTAGYEVRGVADNSWGETTITYQNAPAPSGITATSGAVNAGQTSVDITPLVTGSGLISVALTTSSTGITFSSREARSGAPQLIIQTTTDVPPVNTSPPSISGTPLVGQTLTASPGSWSGTAPISYAYRWRRCDSAGVNCADIVGATSQTYVVASADAGSTVRVAVTASNGVGSSSATSDRTAVVQQASPVAPVNTSPPTISGAALSGQIVSAVPGSWSGTAPISFAYQWRRCDSSGAGCVDIFAATGSTYTLGPADVGATVVVAVTASNSAGSATASSGPSAVVQAAPVPPANTAAPSLSGAAQAGSIVMVSSGGWSGTAPISYAYQWRRCDSGGASCVDIAGATASSYTAASADVGSTLVAVVTASNSAGSSSASSAPSAIVQAANVAPANTAAPTVSGATGAGQTLTASPGTWSGTAPISYAYQWQRCDSSGANCLPVAGATGQTYLLGSADVGSTIRAAVTASNSAGSSTASSLQTTAVTADAGCAPRSSAYSSAILSTAGLVSYWRLGESSGTVACDGAGSNNGVYQAGTTLGQPGAIVSDPDTAVALDGAAGWVQVPASSSLNVGDRFSIEAWVKRGSVGTAASQVVASKPGAHRSKI